MQRGYCARGAAGGGVQHRALVVWMEAGSLLQQRAVQSRERGWRAWLAVVACPQRTPERAAWVIKGHSHHPGWFLLCKHLFKTSQEAVGDGCGDAGGGGQASIARCSKSIVEAVCQVVTVHE
jgi:hypothetical protein